MLFVGGPSAAVRSAAVGAILLALIEGIGICITRMTADQFKPGLTLTVILLLHIHVPYNILLSLDGFPGFDSIVYCPLVMPQPPDPAQLPPKPFNPTPQATQGSEFDYQPQYQ